MVFSLHDRDPPAPATAFPSASANPHTKSSRLFPGPLLMAGWLPSKRPRHWIYAHKDKGTGIVKLFERVEQEGELWMWADVLVGDEWPGTLI